MSQSTKDSESGSVRVEPDPVSANEGRPKALPNDLEALKLLADWSKWCVLIETGVIAAIATLVKPEILGMTGSGPRGFLTGTIVCFGVSIIAAAGLLLSIPATAQRLPPPYPDDIFLLGTYEGTKGVRVYIAVHVQTWTFIAGLICFGIAVIMACWSIQPLPLVIPK